MAAVVMFEPGMKRIDSKARNAAHEATKRIAAEARIYTPVLTGAMRRSYRVRKTANGSRLYVGTNHWWYVEYGTEPHLITTALRSMRQLTPAGGKKWFGKIVNHPGATASRPIRRAFYKKRSMATLLIPGD